MTKYYTIKDCFDACEDDDIPYIKGGANSVEKNTKIKLTCGSPIYGVSYTCGLSDKWQIERAKPKIMTAEECLKREKHYGIMFDESQMINMYSKGEQNGILKERVSWQEILDAYEKSDTPRSYYDVLIRELNDLGIK